MSHSLKKPVWVHALTGMVFTAETLSKDEVFSLNRAVTITGSALVSFDISWFDRDLNQYYWGDQSNKSVDVISIPQARSHNSNQDFVGARTIDDQGNVGCTKAQPTHVQ